jgi:hypothetical protein
MCEWQSPVDYTIPDRPQLTGMGINLEPAAAKQILSL